MLTQEQRLQVVKEIWAHNSTIPGGYGCGYRVLYAYERAAKEQA